MRRLMEVAEGEKMQSAIESRSIGSAADGRYQLALSISETPSAHCLSKRARWHTVAATSGRLSKQCTRGHSVILAGQLARRCSPSRARPHHPVAVRLHHELSRSASNQQQPTIALHALAALTA